MEFTCLRYTTAAESGTLEEEVRDMEGGLDDGWKAGPGFEKDEAYECEGSETDYSGRRLCLCKLYNCLDGHRGLDKERDSESDKAFVRRQR